ncbi:MAG TPA: hypothetical protein VN841_16045 [Bryobacteraceae bacterium]|nr:hypothetical protein [Bryobacteraceae bacterium]
MNKKLMGIMLGLSLAIGASSLAFAQDDKKTDETKKKGKKKKTDNRNVVTPATVR